MSGWQLASRLQEHLNSFAGRAQTTAPERCQGDTYSLRVHPVENTTASVLLSHACVAAVARCWQVPPLPLSFECKSNSRSKDGIGALCYVWKRAIHPRMYYVCMCAHLHVSVWLTRVKQLSAASITMSIGVVWLATTTLPHFARFCLRKKNNNAKTMKKSWTITHEIKASQLNGYYIIF